MAGDLTAIRQGIATNLGAQINGFAVSPYRTSNPRPPHMWVIPAGDILIEYHQAMRNGMELWHLLVQAYSGANNDITAQQLLDSLVVSAGANSVKTAVESDRTLGGACQDVTVIECRGYFEYNRPDGAALIGAEWAVQVTA